jgi:uncharacterized protein
VPLTDIEVRILGALIEKETTTPDNYPLSLNALVNACNQSSSREPVMSLTEEQVKWAVNSLRQQSLVRAIQPADSRVMKFQHLAAEKLDVDKPQLAVLCVLMLRGPQTLGEIKGRTGRLAEFESLGDVESVVRSLIQRELAVELPRKRFAHLLAGAPSETTEQVSHSEPPRVDRIADLEATVADLRIELAELKARFEEFQKQFG